MKIKGNKIENWNSDYSTLDTTYSSVLNTPVALITAIQNEFVYEDILTYLSNNHDSKILEVGCGGARTTVYLGTVGFSNLTASDNAKGALRLAQSNLDKEGVSATVVNDDLFNTKLQQSSFDCIMSFGLLEHFEDLDKLTKSLTGFLRTGGIHIHVIIPKKFSTIMLQDIFMYPFRFLKRILTGRFSGIFIKSYRDFPHYENSFTYADYCKSFERSGNEIISCQAAGILVPFINLPRPIGGLVVRVFGKLIYRAVRILDRKTGHFYHIAAPTFYLIARKK
jgi:2-polyprenyl-3-methyl-5-hydroxy-6-metoxy-1,4-benzoquinol methylase